MHALARRNQSPNPSRVLYRRPFQSFFIRLESGDRLDINHPENISFDPEEGGDADLLLVVRTRDVRAFTTLEAVTGIALKVKEEAA